MAMIFSLSTSWHYQSAGDGARIVAKTRDIGFENLEINFQVKETYFKEIAINARQGQINITSLHNICPLTPEMEKAGNYIEFFDLASNNNEIRKEAIRLSERTLQNAADLNASAVVFHLGDVSDGTLRLEEKAFRKPLKAELGPPESYRAYFDKLLMRRDAGKDIHLDNARRSLDYLVPVAEKLGVCIGMENRYYVSQIPNCDEFGILLSEYNTEYLGLWYDTGHAANISNLGYWDSLEYLRKYKDRVVGIHIHDCIGIRDHLPPGDGDIDFLAIKGFLPKDTLCVLEMRPQVAEEDLRRGVRHLRALGFLD